MPAIAEGPRAAPRGPVGRPYGPMGPSVRPDFSRVPPVEKGPQVPGLIPRAERTFDSRAKSVAWHELNHVRLARRLGIDVTRVSVIPSGDALGITEFAGHIDLSRLSLIAAGGGAYTPDGPKGFSGGPGSDKYLVDYIQFFHGGPSWDELVSQANMLLSEEPEEVVDRMAELLAHYGEISGAQYEQLRDIAVRELEFERKMTEMTGIKIEPIHVPLIPPQFEEEQRVQGQSSTPEQTGSKEKQGKSTTIIRRPDGVEIIWGTEEEDGAQTEVSTFICNVCGGNHPRGMCPEKIPIDEEQLLPQDPIKDLNKPDSINTDSLITTAENGNDKQGSQKREVIMGAVKIDGSATGNVVDLRGRNN